MISYLEGVIKFVKKDNICLLVNNVGYKIEVVQNRIYNEGDNITMYISTVVREDSIRFFGFDNREELELFDQLTTVSGVGPKIALAILEIGRDKIVDAILDENLGQYKIKGVGSKTLEKIIIELNGKLKLISKSSPTTRTKGVNQPNYEKFEEVEQALLNLGFVKREIEETLSNLSPTEKELDSREIIKIVLKNLRIR